MEKVFCPEGGTILPYDFPFFHVKCAILILSLSCPLSLKQGMLIFTTVIYPGMGQYIHDARTKSTFLLF